jgi:hypothetical protein
MSEQVPIKVSVLLVALLLAGCDLSNDQVIAETKKCEAAGMRAMPAVRLFSGRIAEIQCWPKEEIHE